MNEKKEDGYDRLIRFVKRDFIYIAVCLLAIFACVYTWGAAKDYEARCNLHWADEMIKCGCLAGKNQWTGEMNPFFITNMTDLNEELHKEYPEISAR